MAIRRVATLSLGAAGTLAWALLAAGSAAGPAQAQDAQADTPMQLFVSPAGKPYRAAMDKPYPVADWFAAADADHDGKLTKAEFRTDAQAFFKELDVNKDGVISPAEIARYERVVAPEIVAGFTPDSGEAQPAGDDAAPAAKDTPQGAAWFSFMGEPEPVSAADGNFDGIITLPEFLKAADERFVLLDFDHKGYLTLKGLPDSPVEKNLKRSRKRRW